MRVQSERLTAHCFAEERAGTGVGGGGGGAELTVRINNISVTVTKLRNDTQPLEADLANLLSKLEEAMTVQCVAEHRADRAQVEVNRLVEERGQVCLSVMTVIVTSSAW